MIAFLQRLGVDTSGYDRWQVQWAGASSILVWIIAAALLLALLAWTRSSVRDLRSRPRRIFIMCWQALTAAFIIALMFQPAIRLAQAQKIKDRVAVLYDASASMSLPGSAGDTRAAEAFEFIDDHAGFFKDLEDEFVVTYLGFDTETHESAGRPDKVWAAEGRGSDLAGALSALTAGGAPLAGVVMVTDGADTSRLGTAFSKGGGREGAAALADFPAPVNTVAVGQGGNVQDLAIVRVQHDDYGFVHNPFEVEVEISSEGGLAEQVPVVFKQGTQLLASKTIALPPGQKTAAATLSFTPRQVGEFMFSVEIPPVPGELTAANNVVRFPLKVLRDKVRVLYLVGNPSWDERFLRQALKKNPIVDLVCFYILREIHDNYYAGQDEVSLIEFPTHKLFTEELDTFDLLIWQNFYGPEYMGSNYKEYMDKVNHFVRVRGGAVLMLGGLRGYWGSNAMDRQLLDILPVEPAPEVPNYVSEDFPVALTDAGRRHPIMDVGDPGEDLAALWGRLPELAGYNHVARLAPQGLALAVKSGPPSAGEPAPIVAVREAGAGRVMAVMSDCSWQWSLPAVGEGMSGKPYQRFWENSLRWLLRDPELRLVTFSAASGRTAPGQAADLMIEVLDESYQPTDGAALALEVIEQPEGSALVLPEPERYAAGKYRLAVTPAAAGGYRLRVTATVAGRSLGYDEVIFEASDQDLEWFNVVPLPELLAAVSEATGGAAIASGGDPDGFVFKRTESEQITGARDVPVWDNAPVFLAGFAMMVVGWYFRRRWGLR